jgi:hypothetical protein
MPKDSINRWVAIAGFAALAAVLVLEGAALSLTFQDRGAIEARTQQPQPMMHFLFDRIASGNFGGVAAIARPERSRI